MRVTQKDLQEAYVDAAGESCTVFLHIGGQKQQRRGNYFQRTSTVVWENAHGFATAKTRREGREIEVVSSGHTIGTLEVDRC